MTSGKHLLQENAKVNKANKVFPLMPTNYRLCFCATVEHGAAIGVVRALSAISISVKAVTAKLFIARKCLRVLMQQRDRLWDSGLEISS